jgi:hypothetical protein
MSENEKTLLENIKLRGRIKFNKGDSEPPAEQPQPIGEVLEKYMEDASRDLEDNPWLPKEQA